MSKKSKGSEPAAVPDNAVEVYALPSFLAGKKASNDEKSVHEAKRRRKKFPESAARRFAKRNEDRIYGYVEAPPYLRSAIKDLIRNLFHQCQAETVSRLPVTLDNVEDCRPGELLLLVNPGDRVWSQRGTQVTVRQSDIFDRVILPQDSRGHYIPLLDDKRLYLPLSQYRPEQLAALSEATEKLARVVAKHFGVHKNWRAYRRAAEEIESHAGLPLAHTNRVREQHARIANNRGGRVPRVSVRPGAHVTGGGLRHHRT